MSNKSIEALKVELKCIENKDKAINQLYRWTRQKLINLNEFHSLFHYVDDLMKERAEHHRKP